MTNPRYFATYRTLQSGQCETVNVSFGRFYDSAAAERRAKESYDVKGCSELISVRPESATEARLYQVSRFFIRTFRVACGACLGLVAYALLPDSGIGDIPFSSLTLNMIVSRLFWVALCIGAGWLGWYIAFGEGPEH